MTVQELWNEYKLAKDEGRAPVGIFRASDGKPYSAWWWNGSFVAAGDPDIIDIDGTLWVIKETHEIIAKQMGV